MCHFLFENSQNKTSTEKTSSNADWFIEIVSVNQQKAMKKLVVFVCFYVFYPFHV